MKSKALFCNLAMFLCFFTSLCSAYKILGIMPSGFPSHYILGSSLMKELARRGHEVTVIAPFSLKKPMKNFCEILIPNAKKKIMSDMESLPDLQNKNFVTGSITFHNFVLGATEKILEEDNVQQLINGNKTFDVVFCEVFLSEALFGLAEHFKAPLIGFSTFGAHSWNSDMVGSPSPPSYVPNPFFSFTDHMSLVERIGNLAALTFDRLFLDFYFLPKQAELYNKFFPNAKRNMYEVRKNTALVLLNQHVSLSFPRPYMPNHIEVGGLHINRQRSPLPADIQKFIDDAKDGVIYFSMGSTLKSKELPLEKRKVILETFRGLKQRVLWKFEEPNLADKPENVFISDWFPQDDILAHPNVKMFITHGGLLGITESIYHGKPFIGIPIFGDQFFNMARAERNGYGFSLNFKDLSVESFSKAIHKMLNEPGYTETVAAMSERYRDQPMNPLDLAVFWVEHVARHKGAEYLHCAGLDLNFIQYHNLDAILLLYGGMIFAVGVFLWLLRKVFSRCFGRKQTQKAKLKRN